MSSNVIKSKEVDAQKKLETSLVKYKLRIALIFLTAVSKQKEKRDNFRKKSKMPQSIVEKNFADEFEGCNVRYFDNDSEDIYKFIDMQYVIHENSPREMERVSKDIDKYIECLCKKSDVSEVVPFLFVPSFSIDSCISELFFSFYTPKCLTKNSKIEKISLNKGRALKK